MSGVLDASALVVALCDDGPAGDEARARLIHEALAAPEILDLEVLSAIRGLGLAGQLPPRRARQAVDDLIDIPINRAQHLHLLPRCWELRDNCTPNDAAYVALAELLEATLVTADRRLASSPGIRCRTDLLGSPGAT